MGSLRIVLPFRRTAMNLVSGLVLLSLGSLRNGRSTEGFTTTTVVSPRRIHPVGNAGLLASETGFDEGPTYENRGRQRTDPEGSVLGLTENQGLTYKKTGKKCLDLSFDVTPGIERESLEGYLQEAWEEDPLTTLKLIVQLGDPRQGKGDRTNLYQGLLWLYEHHFETLMLNIEKIGRFSYHKSLLDLLVLALDGPDALDDQRPVRQWQSIDEREDERLGIHTNHVREFFRERAPQNNLRSPEPPTDGFQRRSGRRGFWSSDELRREFVDFMNWKNRQASETARILRKEKEGAMTRSAEVRYASDEKYRRLYDSVASNFARGLEMDLQTMQDDEAPYCIGGYAKWAPTPRGSHDRRTNICEGIIQRLYPDRYQPRDSRLRCEFRRRYLSSVRRAAEVPESFVGAGEWHRVNYRVMPSVCRQTHGAMYRRHDPERYDAFLSDARQRAERGERVTTVAAGALLPHEIVGQASRSDDDGRNDEHGLQWLRLVQDVTDKGDLASALAVCDVSGSMEGTPLDVCVALGMLLADATRGPFANRVVTFSAEPELVRLPQPTVDNLASRASFVRGMDWGYNTDFQAVFELLLRRAVEEQAAAEEMPSILFCFSDMEFDEAQASSANWKTDLELLRSRYARAGYAVPTLVFWNLDASGSKPASCEEEGVVMLSGFSAGMLKSFLEFRLDDIPTPFEQMLEMLSPYDGLVLAPEDELPVLPEDENDNGA